MRSTAHPLQARLLLLLLCVAAAFSPVPLAAQAIQTFPQTETEWQHHTFAFTGKLTGSDGGQATRFAYPLMPPAEYKRNGRVYAEEVRCFTWLECRDITFYARNLHTDPTRTYPVFETRKGKQTPQQIDPAHIYWGFYLVYSINGKPQTTQVLFRNATQGIKPKKQPKKSPPKRLFYNYALDGKWIDTPILDAPTDTLGNRFRIVRQQEQIYLFRDGKHLATLPPNVDDISEIVFVIGAGANVEIGHTVRYQSQTLYGSLRPAIDEAYQALEAQEFARAETLYTEILNAGYNAKDIVFNRAFASLGLRRYEAAIQQFEAVVAYDNDPQARQGLDLARQRLRAAAPAANKPPVAGTSRTTQGSHPNQRWEATSTNAGKPPRPTQGSYPDQRLDDDPARQPAVSPTRQAPQRSTTAATKPEQQQRPLVKPPLRK